LAESAQESLIRGLSRFRDIFADRPSVVNLDGLPKDFPDSEVDTTKDPWPDYLIYGSYVGDKNRIHLILNLQHLVLKELIWSMRLVLRKEDLDLLDQKITSECVAPIVLYLQRCEQESSNSIPHPKEEKLFRQAQSLMSRRTLRALDQARRLLMALARSCGEIGDVYIALARAEHEYGKLLAGERFAEALEKARVHAKKAIELDDLNPRAHAELALQEMFLRRYRAAAAAYLRALDLNPYDPLLWSDWGECLTFMGRATEALPILEKAASGWPRDRVWVEWNLCDAEWALNRPERIVEILANQPDMPHVHRYLAASHAKLGRMAKARRHAAKVRRHQPDFSAKAWREVPPWQDRAVAQDYGDCLARAGL
jgi:tetratricopeptide (TPR) repeat protein